MKMQIILQAGSLEFELEHGGETLRWDGQPFIRRSLGKSVDVTTHINQFWAGLPDPQQQVIFDLYQRIYEVIRTTFDAFKLILALRPLIAQLSAIHSYEKLNTYYAWTETNILIPDDLKEAYEPGDNFTRTREKTYTRGDYKDLVILVLMLRPLMPIWGEFVARTQDSTSTSLKEYYAYQILAKAVVMNCPGMTKLVSYIHTIVEREEISPAVAVDGLGSDELENHLLGSVLVTRVCVGDLTGKGGDDDGEARFNLIVAVYKYVKSRLAAINQTGGVPMDGLVKSKKPQTGPEGDDDQSVLEGFKVKQAHAIGAYMPYVMFTEMTEQFMKAVHPDLPLGLYQHMLANSRHLREIVPMEGQINLMHWIIGDVIPPGAEGYLDREHMANCIALAQTWLWHFGHKRLAAMITAVPTQTSGGVMLSGNGSLQKIPQELQEKAIALYPHQKIGRGRQRTRPTPRIIDAINEVSDQFNTRDWILHLSAELAPEVVGKSANMRAPCPPDIKTLLCNVVLDLNRLSV